MNLAPSSSPTLAPAAKVSTIGHQLVGSFRDDDVRLDFEQIDLRADGTYVARVQATLVNPGVRTFGASCMLPENGAWNAYVVTTGPQNAHYTRLRIRPTTGRARVYITTLLEDGGLSISRRGVMTVLTRTAGS